MKWHVVFAVYGRGELRVHYIDELWILWKAHVKLENKNLYGLGDKFSINSVKM